MKLPRRRLDHQVIVVLLIEWIVILRVRRFCDSEILTGLWDFYSEFFGANPGGRIIVIRSHHRLENLAGLSC